MIIRCSSLPGWDDCSRRTALRLFPEKISETTGHKPAEILPSVGAAIGTAVHAGAALYLIARRDGDLAPKLQECVDVACASLHDTVAFGATWDATTPNQQVAYDQVARMVRVYLPHIEQRRPKIVEEKMEATLRDGNTLSGHVDDFEHSGWIDDLKTGVPPRTYIAQIGGYILNLEANGHQVTAASMTFLKRVPLKKPQPKPVQTDYDIEEAKMTAWRALEEIQNTMAAYTEHRTPHVIRANPMSLMCTKKYCPAWGTDFCTSHQGEHEEA